MKLRAPFPWYGGKSLAAPLIWQAFGNGWCHPDVRVGSTRRPNLNNVHGHGVIALAHSLPLVGTPGNGVHAPTMGKKPLTHRGKGIHRTGAAIDTFELLARRLRHVRICCGDWSRVLGRSTLGIDTAHGMTPCAILLDPPYPHESGRRKQLYAEDGATTSAAAREWALDHGDNPQVRIALCGWEGEHEMPSTWRCIAWKPDSTSPSRARERVWFSPHCLEVGRQGELFTRAGA